jgi:hypothetical protein
VLDALGVDALEVLEAGGAEVLRVLEFLGVVLEMLTRRSSLIRWHSTIYPQCSYICNH